MSNLNLWYNKPACKWEEAIPVGNGRIGGMVYGKVKEEIIQLNEDSIWYGSPHNRNNRDALPNINKVRTLLNEGKIKEAEDLILLSFSGTPESQRHYQPLGNLHIDFHNINGKVENYKRILYMNTAITSTSFTINDINYTRDVFVSAPDDVLVVKLTSNVKNSLSFRAYLRRGKYLESSLPYFNNGLIMKGTCGSEDSISFATYLKAISNDGNVFTIGEYLVVEKATSVTLLLSASTTFRSKNPEKKVINQINNASSYCYEELLCNHLQDYQTLFNRVNLEIEKEPNNFEKIPTDERIKNFNLSNPDISLIEKYFQFGRYLLISSSRPDTLPSNIKGIWNKDLTPNNNSSYDLTLSTQMTYWPAEITNLSECHLSLFELIQRMTESGSLTANQMYNCSGFVCHSNTDIWSDTAPQDNSMQYSYWSLGAAWLCLHLWDHYLFNQDIDFLIDIYPIMKESSLFLIDYLIKNNDGKYIISPSLVPYNSYKHKESIVNICNGTSLDTQIITSIFDACIKTTEILNIDEDFKNKLSTFVSNLPDIKLTNNKEISMWIDDLEKTTSFFNPQLFGLYPGNLLNNYQEECSNTIVNQGESISGQIEAWNLNLWSRLKNKEKCSQTIENLITKFSTITLLNLSDSMQFNLDGNCGGTSGIAEMFVQSHNNLIELLPSLPKFFNTGEITGLKARGGFVVDIFWKDTIVYKAIISSTTDNICNIKSNSDFEVYNNKELISSSSNNLASFPTIKGQIYEILTK